MKSSEQEHTIRLRELAVEIANDLEDFSTTDKDNLLDMLEIHDWAEAIDGDEAIVTNDEEDRKKRLTVKYEREYNTKIFELWIRFENSDDKIALLARQLDKFQAIEKALEYEHAQGIPLFQEFYNYSHKSISHPVLLKRLEKMKDEIK